MTIIVCSFSYLCRQIREQAAQELAAVEAEPIDSDSDMDENHYSPAPPEPDHNSMDTSESAHWTQVQAPDEDSRHSFVSNHEEHAITGTGMKITLAKPITLQGSPIRDQKRRKSDLREVFNPDEDDSNIHVKKRKLVPLGNLIVHIQSDNDILAVFKGPWKVVSVKLAEFFIVFGVAKHEPESHFAVNHYLKGRNEDSDEKNKMYCGRWTRIWQPGIIIPYFGCGN